MPALKNQEHPLNNGRVRSWSPVGGSDLGRRSRWRNIGREERRKRNIYGLLSLGAIVALALWHRVVPDLAWVLGLGLLAWTAALCLLQARAGICVFHAARGCVDFGRGPMPIRSPRIQRILRRKAVRVHLLAATSWGVTTTLGVLVKI